MVDRSTLNKEKLLKTHPLATEMVLLTARFMIDHNQHLRGRAARRASKLDMSLAQYDLR